MSQPKSTLRIRRKSVVDREIGAFLIDRRARGLAPGSVRFYAQKLAHLRGFTRTHGITTVEAITPRLLRQLLLDFGEEHNAGGTHALFRAIKAFMRWYEIEVEPTEWKNPIEKVASPRVPTILLEPAPLEHVRALVATCRGKGFHDRRDRAILLFLLDTGCRASEVIALNVDDVDLRVGSVLVRSGKGRKPRTVFVGARTRRALVAYLRLRPEISETAPLFSSCQGKRLCYGGLRDIIRRRAARAQVSAPTLHSFRRAFALLALRNGMDIYSLQRLMGHADLAVLRRYLAQTQEDLRRAHERTGPVDTLL